MERAERKTSVLRIISICTATILAVGIVVFVIYRLATGLDTERRWVGNVGTALLLVLPFIVELLMRKKLSTFLIVFYLVYVIFAAVIGNVINLYGSVSWYDKAMHGIFGYIGCIAGLFILCKSENIDTLRPFTVIVSCFLASMAFGGIWELMEFLSDVCMGQIAQGAKVLTVDGNYITDVTDSMLDLTANFIGAIVFVVHYIVHTKTKKGLLLGKVKDDFKRQLIGY